MKTDPTGSADGDFLIIGDLNAYAQEDPVTFLEAEGYTDLIEQYREFIAQTSEKQAKQKVLVSILWKLSN
ncbi:MAG: hypothetical protein WBA93_32315 [Microcoleaceae cyanobacterium]